MRINHLAILILFFFSLNAFSAIETEVTPNTGDIDTLYSVVFTITGSSNAQLPDFSPLENDFDIESTSQSTQISVFNGRMNAEKKWVLMVRPKHTGELTIPTIHVGQEKSSPHTIKVTKSLSTNQAKDAPKKSAFLENSLDNDSPYVQSEVRYTVKLFFKNRLSDANFKEPQAKGVVFMQLGSPKNYQTTIDGNRYYVLEQAYALFPEKSGQIIISPPVFDGIIERDQPSRIDRILMDLQKPIRLRGKSLTLNVQPIATGFNAKNWLPAKHVSLTESWEGLDSPIEVGKPITRIITINALGVTQSQIPTLKFKSSDALSVYQDKGKSQNSIKDAGVFSTKEIKVVYIPNIAGQLSLPEITLPWWNTRDNQHELASLPTKNLVIHPIKSISNDTPPMQKSPILTTPKASKISLAILIPWLIVGALSLSWLIFLGRRKGFFKRKKSMTKSKSAALALKSKLKDACYQDKPQDTLNALMAYMALSYPTKTFTSLNDIADFFNCPSLKDELDNLATTLYAKHVYPWSGKNLWQLLHKQKKMNLKKKSKEGTKLPPLNPI